MDLDFSLSKWEEIRGILCWGVIWLMFYKHPSHCCVCSAWQEPQDERRRPLRRLFCEMITACTRFQDVFEAQPKTSAGGLGALSVEMPVSMPWEKDRWDLPQQVWCNLLSWNVLCITLFLFCLLSGLVWTYSHLFMKQMKMCGKLDCSTIDMCRNNRSKSNSSNGNLGLSEPCFLNYKVRKIAESLWLSSQTL